MTPDFTCPTLPALDKKKDLIVQNNELFSGMRPEERDPDLTQLEIEISSTSISSSQNLKKRQLVTINDNSDIHSIQVNDLGCAFSDENE